MEDNQSTAWTYFLGLESRRPLPLHCFTLCLTNSPLRCVEQCSQPVICSDPITSTICNEQHVSIQIKGHLFIVQAYSDHRYFDLILTPIQIKIHTSRFDRQLKKSVATVKKTRPLVDTLALATPHVHNIHLIKPPTSPVLLPCVTII